MSPQPPLSTQSKPSLKGRNFLSLADIDAASFSAILATATAIKSQLKGGNQQPILAGKTLAMIFEKPSLRTRSTFDIGMYQLGGHTLLLDNNGIQLGTRETLRDTASNLSRWVDGIMARTYAHMSVRILADHASVPVINGLSDWTHPCQLLADYLTLHERFGSTLQGLKLVYVGDGNNVAHSHIFAAIHSGIDLTIACPEAYKPDEDVLSYARERGASVTLHHEPREAIQGAQVLYTDVWVSMGQEGELLERKQAFQGYTITPAWFADLAKDGVFMHDLPAHYGEECEEACVYSPQSIVFDQAENRLHAQKGLLVELMA